VKGHTHVAGANMTAASCDDNRTLEILCQVGNSRCSNSSIACLSKHGLPAMTGEESVHDRQRVCA